MVAEREIRAGISSQLERLNTIDWDFPGAQTSNLTHRLHPYPAKYIPQIPHALIQELSSPGETVADIFCGSGTTLVEALTLKRNAVGVDANPLACLISEAKTTRVTKEDESLLSLLVKRTQTLANSIAIQNQGLFYNPLPFISAAPRPLNEAVAFWFEPFVIEELAEVLSWCRDLPTESSQKIALAAFSSIIVSVSKQDSDTRYVRRQKNLLPGDVLKRFARALMATIEAVKEFTTTVDSHFHCKVHHANILERPDIGNIDLVVCSPPYPNAYSYHLYHMTRMVWLGMDQPRFKSEEIGSHRKYSRKGPGGATIETFRNEMNLVFHWLNNHLRPHRYVCFVVGDSTIHGQRVSNADLISNVASTCGFYETGRIHRHMQATKKAFNPVIGKIKTEQILVLQKSGERV